jgi:hypothetical protein
MDGTLCDYDSALRNALETLRSPGEESFMGNINHAPTYLKARANLIRASIEWWANLPTFNLGIELWSLFDKYECRKMILTQGPKKNANAWTGKKMWIDANLGEDVEVTITRDKGLVYGKILVDDYPPYCKAWLEYRPRCLVIMPVGSMNSLVKFNHPQVIRYDGKNFEEVEKAVKKRLGK